MFKKWMFCASSIALVVSIQVYAATMPKCERVVADAILETYGRGFDIESIECTSNVLANGVGEVICQVQTDQPDFRFTAVLPIGCDTVPTICEGLGSCRSR